MTRIVARKRQQSAAVSSQQYQNDSRKTEESSCGAMWCDAEKLINYGSKLSELQGALPHNIQRWNQLDAVKEVICYR